MDPEARSETQKPNRHFAPGAEFARIERMFPDSRYESGAQGLGDDGFVWAPRPGETLVAASDVSVEGVHYRLDWASPARAVRKALLSNLSDINAMGGRTRMALFNLGARPDWDDAVYGELGAAIRALEAAHGFLVRGGDTTTVPDGSFFSFSVIGTVEGRPLLRGDAKAGSRIYVSGSLGGSSAGLSALRGNGPRPPGDSTDPLTETHLDPNPPLELGPALARLNSPERPIAAIDVSDGLSSELWHLARRSGCRLRVDASRLPVHPALAGAPFAAVRGHVLHGGEEYQLLFTGDFTPGELETLRAIAVITEIGEVLDGEGVSLAEEGAERNLESGGWKHGNPVE